MNFWLALAASCALISLIQLNTALVADRSRWTVAVQPLIALAWCLGVSGVAKGPAGIAGYVLGSTLGAAIVAIWRGRPCS